MTTQISTSIPASTPPNGVLHQLSAWLTKTSEGLEKDEQQKASFLIALSLVFIPIAVITVFSTPIEDMINGEGFTTPNIGGILGVVITVIAYGLGRTKHHKIGAYIIVAMPFVAVLGAGLNTESLLSDIGLIFLSISFILSSLLLSTRSTIITGFVAMSATAFLYFFKADASQEFPYLIILFMGLTTGTLSLTSRVREQNLEELIATQDELKERIEETENALVKAEQADRVKSVFLASMSHELRTPLNAIINFTRFVIKGLMGPVNDEQVDTLNNVVISGKHLLNLINDVLDMSKIESGSLNLFISDDVDINNILHLIGDTGRALLDEKPIELKINVEGDIPLMRGDQQRIHQVFLNIVSNACKFTDEGAITINAQHDDDEIIVSITDTGAGIMPGDQASVFDAFKQTVTGLRQGGGTGLGMPITKSLVEAHNGTIRLESVPNEGTTFFIHLPIRSEKLKLTLLTES